MDYCQWVVPSMYEEVDVPMTIIAAGAALVWMFWLFHISYSNSGRKVLLLQCACGFVLGVASTWLTIFLIYVEQYLGYGEGETNLERAIYCFAGIGLREETAKLVCFLPLVPWVMRQGTPLTWLLVASSVGAGFAAEENINYFTSTMGSAFSGRFLTANFLHLALTGLAGYALCMAIRWPRTHVNYAISVFLGAIMLHGLYNSFLMVDPLTDYSLFSMIVLVLMGNYFFQVLQPLRPSSKPRLSLTMTFCVGLVASLSLALVVLSAVFGMGSAMHLLVGSTLSSIIIIFMFIRGINDGLTE